MSKYKYLMLTNHVHKQLLDEELTRTGLYQWLNVHRGIIRPSVEVPPEDYEKFDIIHINLSAQDANLVKTVKDTLGKNSSTKLIANGDYTCELWQSSLPGFGYPEAVRRDVQEADAIFGTEYFMCTAMGEWFKKKIYLTPHPCDTKRLKSLRPKHPQEVISTMWHRYDKQTFIPWLVTRNQGKLTQLIGYNGKEDKEVFHTETMYNRIYQATNFPEYCDMILDSEVFYDPFLLHSWGRATVDSAALGVPTVGSNRVQSVNLCFPETKVHPFDISKSRDLIAKVLKDDKFKEEIIKTAQENVDFYGHEQCKERYMKIIEDIEDEKNKRKGKIEDTAG